MAKKIFEVEISNNGPKGYETAVSLRMPATWSEFHDALQKARIKDGRSCGNELLYVGYDGLQRGMIGRNVNLYDLNLLAQRLAALTPEENTGMETLLAMEWSRHRGSVSMEHLINLTYNTDACCLAPQVSNLQELGVFLYESEMLSNEAMALLDTMEKGSRFQIELLKLLGEQHKEDHGGVFTSRGYAELGGEIRPVYAYQPGETTYFQRSGAPVVLEVRKGFFNDPQYDNDKTAILNLPAIDKGVWQAAEALIQKAGEQKLLEALTDWESRHNYAKDSARTVRHKALQLHISRIFDNPRWVNFIPFNREYRPEVLEHASLVTVINECCGKPGEVTQEQIDGACTGTVACPHCGRWSSFSIVEPKQAEEQGMEMI